MRQGEGSLTLITDIPIERLLTLTKKNCNQTSTDDVSSSLISPQWYQARYNIYIQSSLSGCYQTYRLTMVIVEDHTIPAKHPFSSWKFFVDRLDDIWG